MRCGFFEQEIALSLGFTGERIVPGALDCEPTFAQKMYQEHVARYAFAAQFAADADVLDVGCGVGYGTQWLGNAGARSVLGFDVSVEAIEHARMHYFHPAVSFKVQDATEIASIDGYDLVTCFELIEHIEKQEKVLDLIKSSLRGGGVLVISTPRPLEDLRTHFHVHEMTFEELYGLLKERFRYVEPYYEVNCFTSFVGRERPEFIEQIVPVSTQFAIGQADYFIFLASDEPLERKATVRPVLALNDDSYVLQLERDVGVLRRAENDHLERIADLEQEKQALAVAHAQAVQQGGSFAAIQDSTGAIRAAVEQVNHNVCSRLDELENEAAQRRGRTEELEALVAARSDELDRVRRNLAEIQRSLATVETEAFKLRADVERLPDVLARASSLENEATALRHRLEHAEATLARFRGSLSWALTRPVRGIGRGFRKLAGRSPIQ